ncbi:MAG: UDP-N-acetylmuramyl-tripeptide synthetase [Myxococcales bacterium]|nr:UDP-N-acetylmuramyl-tripeptide synthetase [Myxococcales bacterium]
MALITAGVTGTNGKTTTTTLLAAALATVARPVARVTTLGFFLDDAEQAVTKSEAGFLEVMRRAEARGARFAAIEYTSEALARGYAKTWPARVAAFTNLSHDHLDAHGSPEHYLASKAQLFMHLPVGGTAILNGCDEACALLAEVVPAGVPIVWYGLPSRGDPHAALELAAVEVEVTLEGTRVLLANGQEITTRAIGEPFAENALAAYGAALALGVPVEDAAAAIAAAAPPAGRFEIVSRAPNVVVDYAHSPDALARTVATARRLCAGRLTVVFGAGGNRDRDKRGPMGAAAASADRVVLTADNPRDEDPHAIAEALRAGLVGHGVVEEILDRATAITTAIREAGPQDLVLIAGKGHEREQTVGHRRVPFDDRAVARAAVER